MSYVYGYNPQPIVYSSTCLLTPTFTQTYWFSRITLSKPRDMNKTKKLIVQLQPSTNFTTLNPLFIYITAYLRQTFTQTYWFARLTFT